MYAWKFISTKPLSATAETIDNFLREKMLRKLLGHARPTDFGIM
jgi:hypothetical protein